IYDFRIKNIEGFYVRYMHQCVVLDQSKNGETWLSLVISHLLSEPDENRKPQRRLINFKTGKLHLFNNNDDNLNSNIILSKREKEILILMSRGYNSINISDKLHISINTVNNHRQSILRKTKTNNTVQVVFYSKKLGLI
ncbi:MAG: response regulator transcription factor, partial [Proteobacteria bacterium]|nr:response regulator transcription factor [Pseudomonadota bacterium]